MQSRAKEQAAIAKLEQVDDEAAKKYAEVEKANREENQARNNAGPLIGHVVFWATYVISSTISPWLKWGSKA